MGTFNGYYPEGWFEQSQAAAEPRGRRHRLSGGVSNTSYRGRRRALEPDQQQVRQSRDGNSRPRGRSLKPS